MHRLIPVRLTLLVPELLWPEPGGRHAPPLPGFAWLAGRAAFRQGPASPFEIALAGRFGMASQGLGALRLFGEASGDLAADGYWLCADPVHLRFHHERIVLADASAFDLAEGEARELVDALNAEFADVGELHAATARRWYLRLNPAGDAFAELRGLAAAPLSAVAGRRVDLAGRGAAWSRWLNAVQMALHRHPLNARREEAGLPAVNSLWPWGGGGLTRSRSSPFSAVWSDHPLAAGLAHAAGAPHHPLPDGLDALLRLASSGSAPLVVLDHLLAPACYEDHAAWQQAWRRLETVWFGPLRRQLGRSVAALEIIAPTAFGELQCALQGRDRWKFWRRPAPLAALADRFAKGKP